MITWRISLLPRRRPLAFSFFLLPSFLIFFFLPFSFFFPWVRTRWEREHISLLSWWGVAFFLTLRRPTSRFGRNQTPFQLIRFAVASAINKFEKFIKKKDMNKKVRTWTKEFVENFKGYQYEKKIPKFQKRIEWKKSKEENCHTWMG